MRVALYHIQWLLDSLRYVVKYRYTQTMIAMARAKTNRKARKSFIAAG